MQFGGTVGTPTSPRVLVAEDDAFRDALIRILGGEGYEVESYPDAGSALTRVEGDPSRGFDLILVDIVMPGIDGLELVDRVRRLLSAPPRVIYMSGVVEPALNDLPGTIGGEPILTKPFGPEQLLAAVEAAIAPGPAAASRI